jgi:hypothetical protein
VGGKGKRNIYRNLIGNMLTSDNLKNIKGSGGFRDLRKMGGDGRDWKI